MGRWKLALGAIIVLAIIIWDVGLPGKRSSPTSVASNSSSPIAANSSPTVSATPSASAVPNSQGIPGVIQPTGSPEFSATFTGTHLDSSIWDTCYPFLKPDGCTNYGNKEYEWYKPSQVRVSGGYLHLIAQPEKTVGEAKDGTPETYLCRSGMITSYPGLKFQYGYLQVKAWIPASNGLWPALWLAAANFQWPPEMDMIETWGDNLEAGSYFHFGKSNIIRAPIRPAQLATGWHTFALSWTRSQMTWLLDGKVILTVTQNVPHQKMYLIADLAEFKPVNSQPDTCDNSMLIKSVELWRA